MQFLNAPIILFCSERSGSNLISKIFDAHPQVCAPGACHLFRVMSECACKYEVGSDALRQAVLELFEAKVSRWKVDEWPSEQRADILACLTQAGEMAAAFYNSEAIAAGKPYSLLREDSAFRYLQFLHSQCDLPRYLFMVRDPRDMALSWMRGTVMRGGVLRATERWVDDQNGYLAAIPHLSPGTPFSFLRYEDLLVAPGRALRRVCSELGLDYSPAMIQFYDRSRSAKADAQRSSMWSNLDKPLISDNSQKFLSGLTDDQVAYVEAVAGPLMTTFGYETARRGMPPFGIFDTLDALRADLVVNEPYDKAAYQELNAVERERFERWSQVYAQMSALPPLAPEHLIKVRL